MVSFGLSLEETARLHGHKGPWLVIGYRAGTRAREVLKPKTEHDLRCIARLPKKIPYTCSLDGIQASTSCTLGKLSIEVEDTDGVIEFEFINRSTGRRLKLRLKSEIVDIVEEIYRREGLSGAAKFIEEIELCRLFEEYLS